MKMPLPAQLELLANALSRPLYVVGGACRDFLAELNCVGDIDICAPVLVDELITTAQELGFGVSAVYKNTGTVKLNDGNNTYEYAAFRSDSYIRGEHTPESVCFTDDIYLDALRRDFKCNAVYYDVCAQTFIDPLGGIEDIKNKKMSTVRDSNRVFGEDGLRLMRLARQCAALGFTPTSECLEGAKNNCSLIDDISPERIYTELMGILYADKKYNIVYAHYSGIKLLHEIGVLKRIAPELCLGEGIVQNPLFHDFDVLEHSFLCLKYADERVRLSALLHDVGKPYCYLNLGTSGGHDKQGEVIARAILTRLKAPKRVIDRACRLIRAHMLDYDLKMRRGKVRRAIIKYYDILDELYLLKQADFSACKNNLSVAPTVNKWKTIQNEMVSEGVPFTLSQLNIRGNELIEAGISPNQVGVILNELLLACALNAKLNERERLIKQALKMFVN